MFESHHLYIINNKHITKNIIQITLISYILITYMFGLYCVGDGKALEFQQHRGSRGVEIDKEFERIKGVPEVGF